MAGVYCPRHPERSVLHRVLSHHFERFLTEYEGRFEQEYGYFRPVVKEVVEKYLDCGNPRCGFARVRCRTCREEYLLTFSCKTRGFCPSCQAKRVEIWGEWVRERLLWDVPHRQVVFTIPKMLRIFFKFKRRLLGDLSLAALRALKLYFEAAAGEPLIPGVIAVIQTFGDRINFHPHLHYLVTCGGLDAAGVFHEIARIDDSRLSELFAREVLAMLVAKGLLSPDWAERLLSWRHSGFNVHSLVRTETKAEAERVGKYMIRPVVSLERLEFIEPEGRVGYRIGRKDGEQETMNYLEFIARVTSHIPDKGQVMVRYYGLYANAYRGRAKKGGTSDIRVLREGYRPLSLKGWAVLIRKVYEVDPLKCPKCGGRMTVMAFLTQASVRDRIIEHLKISFRAERPPPASELLELPLIADPPVDYFS